MQVVNNSKNIEEAKITKKFYETPSKELLNDEFNKREVYKKILLDSFYKWGYQSVLPAILENVELIKKVKPEISDSCFSVIDQNGQFSFLRPDLTIPVARIASGKLVKAQRPLRVCYFGSIFKKKNINNLDQRKEIAQVGAEIIGFSHKELQKAQLEILSVLISNLKKIKLGQFKIVLSHTNSLKELAPKITNSNNRNLDFSKLSECEQKLCYKLTGDPGEVLEFITAQNKKDQIISECVFLEIKKILELEKEVFRESLFLIDLTLRANTNYYSGLYFELIDTNTKKTFGSGGCYNSLSSYFSENPENAVGFSIDLDFLVKQSKLELPEFPVKKSSPLDYSLSREKDFLRNIREFIIN